MPIQFGIQLKNAKAMFFDRPAVMAMLTRKERAMLSKFGAFVRRRAKSSIRVSRKNESAAPGETPKGHTGQLRQKIYFSADPARRSVVIGPTAFKGRSGEELSALEQGGPTTITETLPDGGKKRRRIMMKARPFMLPAFKAELPQVSSLMSQVS